LEAKTSQIEGLSAHVDQKGLLNWLSELEKKPTKVFLVHGENQPADELRVKIKDHYRFECLVTLIGQEFELYLFIGPINTKAQRKIFRFYF
jgi:metallo-beta-lactamase family protein